MAKRSGKRLTPETLVYVCDPVFTQVKPCLLVIHNSNGDGQFLCGSDNHGVDEGQEMARLVHLGHLLAHDPTLKSTLDLPVGHEAERDNVGGAWRRAPLAPEDDDFEEETE